MNINKINKIFNSMIEEVDYLIKKPYIKNK